ncbi:hypothetical protein P1X14_18930 [Sphingomonas sp. AOB5]|uniref:hypothetical protein n=1 Tax=Sphingomonas sp. AOB5 TaxID=3034017 RepID=UPI0023F81E95|nr:hypothetical protein [Sphingomonas sp. AOB5]MDF7777340.1 hypothetical protein [Sphingomonas sp. AOB5]
MARRQTQAERLREHRITLERAMADRVTLDEAARRIAMDALAESQRRAEALRNQPIIRSAPPHQGEQAGKFYWQQGQYR